MPVADLGAIQLTYEAVGDPRDPALLLVSGLGVQLTFWPEVLVHGLVGAGFRVVRFDNRDIGKSTKLSAAGVPDITAVLAALKAGTKPPVPYRLEDMAADAIGLLDHLGIARAHIVGTSMGGAITQHLALDHRDRLLSAVPIMATSGRPGLSPPKPESMQALLYVPPDPTDLPALVENGVKVRTALSGTGYPEDPRWLRGFLRAQVERDYDPAGVGRQYGAIMASGSRHLRLPSITTPTLVIHGADDPLLPVDHGRDIADLIPGGRFESIAGMGHTLPHALCPSLVTMIADFCSSRRAS